MSAFSTPRIRATIVVVSVVVLAAVAAGGPSPPPRRVHPVRRRVPPNIATRYGRGTEAIPYWFGIASYAECRPGESATGGGWE
jgi:hypothetical protein